MHLSCFLDIWPRGWNTFLFLAFYKRKSLLLFFLTISKVKYIDLTTVKLITCLGIFKRSPQRTQSFCQILQTCRFIYSGNFNIKNVLRSGDTLTTYPSHVLGEKEHYGMFYENHMDIYSGYNLKEST